MSSVPVLHNGGVRRLRWPRLALACSAVLLAACGATSPSRGTTSSATTTARAPVQLASGPWERVSLPASPEMVRSFAASPDDPATLFTCTGEATFTSGAEAPTPAPRPLTLWRSVDAGAHWARFALPGAEGTGCAFSIAPDDPRRVTFQVSGPTQHGQPCSGDSFYLSVDDGASWRPLRHQSVAPAGATYGWCDLHATARHLYIAYSYSLGTATDQISILERSDDEGAHWARADQGLGERALFFMPAVGPADSLAVTVLHMPAESTSNAAIPAELWTSPDAGRTWTRAASLPEHPGTFLWSAPPQPGSAWPTAGHPFYALEEEQIPSDLYRETALTSGGGATWRLLAPLPVPGTDGEHAGILQALAALPDGRLAVWGADPRAGVPAEGRMMEPVHGFWLWLWNPAQARWQVLHAPLDVTASEGCGLCWQGQAAASADGAPYLYAVHLADVDTTAAQDVGVWRVRVPSSQ